MDLTPNPTRKVSAALREFGLRFIAGFKRFKLPNTIKVVISDPKRRSAILNVAGFSSHESGQSTGKVA